MIEVLRSSLVARVYNPAPSPLKVVATAGYRAYDGRRPAEQTQIRLRNRKKKSKSRLKATRLAAKPHNDQTCGRQPPIVDRRSPPRFTFRAVRPTSLSKLPSN